MRKAIIFRLIAFLILCFGVFLFVPFLKDHQAFIEAGNGIEFNDPIFMWLPSFDLSLPIFSCTYGALLLYIILHKKIMDLWFQVAMGYGIILLLRTLSLMLLPLAIPTDLVPLEDPFLNNLVYPGNITADLFFSGHVAFVALLYSLTQRLRFIFLALMIVLSIMLIIQRVHYSIDVVTAIPVAIIVGVVVKKTYARIVIDNSSD